MKNYDDLIPEAPAEQPAPRGGNKYDEIISAPDTPDVRATAVSLSALSRNPELSAKARTLGQRYGLPVDVIERNLPELEKRAQQDTNNAVLQRSPLLSRFIGADPDRAAVAIDDLPTFGEIERNLGAPFPRRRTLTGAFRDASAEARREADRFGRALKGARRGGQVAETPVDYSIVDRVRYGYGQARAGLPIAMNELTGLYDGDQFGLALAISDRLRDAERANLATPPAAVAEGARAVGEAEGPLESGVAILGSPAFVLDTVLTSLGQSAPSMLAGVAGAAAGPAGQALGAGTGSLAVEYSASLIESIREAGLTPTNAQEVYRALTDPALMDQAREKALKRGVAIAVFDALTAGLAGNIVRSARGASRAAMAAAVAGEAGLQAAGGAGGELVAQLLTESSVKWGEVFLEGIAEIATGAVEVPSNLRAAREAAEARFSRNDHNAMLAEYHAHQVKQVSELVSATKVLARDPRTLQEFIDSVAVEGGRVEDIYVDARQFAQAVGEEKLAELRQASPAVAAQIDEALAIGGDLVIPLGEFATTIGQSDVMPSVLELIRPDAAEMSLAEAKQFAQTRDDQMLAEAERALEEAGEASDFSRSAAAVERRVMQELQTANRFTEAVNTRYAKYLSAFFTTMAKRTGVLPEQFAGRYSLQVRNEAVQGERRVEQITPEQAMATNVPVELPNDPVFTEAVGNTSGAEITENGLLIDLVRFQKPEQEGAQAIRTGVFYLPAKSENVRHYKTTPSTKFPNPYGGSERMEGATLIRRPLFVKGATGGKAPEAAYDAIKGKGAMKSLDRAVMDVVTSRGFMTRTDPEVFLLRVEQFLGEWGGDRGLADEIIRNSTQGNTLRYALQEHVIAHAVREAGYDAVVGYSKGKAGARISEVFDVREQTFPARGTDSEVHSAFNRSAFTADTIEIDGKTRPALNSNGQRIAQTEEGLRNFWRWFGDSVARERMTSSRQKLADMAPLVLYHTTRSAGFDVFEIGRTTTNSTTFGDVETSRSAVFFTPDREASNAYAGGVGSASMPVYLRVLNPLDLTEGLTEQDEAALLGAGLSYGFVRNVVGRWWMFDGEDGQIFTEALRRAGFDAVIFNDENPENGDSFEAWAVFSPEQIKSVFNRGTFDPTAASILAQPVTTPTSVENFKPGNLHTLLGREDWTILTAHNPMGQQLSPEENAARNERLREELDRRGLDYIDSIGKYVNDILADPPEDGFAVFGVTPEIANEIGNMFEQDSVLTGRGLLYHDMTLNPADGTITEHATPPENYFTSVPQTGALFTMGINFEQRIPFVRQFAQPADRGRVDNVAVVHYSQQPRTSLVSWFYGTGMKGAEYERVMSASDTRLRQRIHFYVSAGQPIVPESGVGRAAHVTTVSNLYDADLDHLKLRRQSRGDANAFESAILDAGYDGYLSRTVFGRQGTVVMLGRRDLRVEQVSDPDTRLAIPPAPLFTEGEILAREIAAHRALPTGSGKLDWWQGYLPKVVPDLAAKIPDGAWDRMRAAFGDADIYRSDLARLFDAPEIGRSFAQTVSTRLPRAMKAVENPFEQMLVVGLESSMADPKGFETNIALMAGYEGFRFTRSDKTAAKKAERMIQHMVDNLLWLHDQTPDEVRQRARLWYDGARRITDLFSERFGRTDVQVAAVLAVLSPQKDWFMNVTLAERVLDIYTNRQDFRWSPEMTQVADDILGNVDPDDRLAIEGRTLRELDGQTYLQALWLRTYDQAHNPRTFRGVDPGGDFADLAVNYDGETNTRAAWGSFGSIGKAIEVLRDGSVQNVSRMLGNEHKVRNFYNNIFNPASLHGDVTIDTHAVAAALLQPLAGSSPEVLHNFGGAGSASSSVYGTSGTYGIYAEAYRRAAAQRGVLPREMQSITWEAVRGLFRPEFKRATSKLSKKDNPILSAWADYRRGKDTADGVRSRVLEIAGGIANPPWFGPRGAASQQPWASSYADVLRDGGGAPGAAGPRDGGVPGQAGAGVGRAFNQQQQALRGQITFGEDITRTPSVISLFEQANLSTFLHETGHFFLEVMADVAARGESAQVADDMNKILRWFGVPDLETWRAMSPDQQRPHHERFARGFERYLMEGQAPSRSLEGLFASFRAWLLSVYRALIGSAGGADAALNVSVSDEVRQVMDRLIATDEEIAEAQDSRRYAPLFKSAEEMGATPAEWAAYQREHGDALEAAQAELGARSLREMRWLSGAKSRELKRLQAEAKAARAAVEEEARAEVRAMPVYAAMRWLKHGEMVGPDGEQIKALSGFKLDIDAVRVILAAAGLDTSVLGVGKYGMAGKDGLAPQVVAEMFGFPNGETLVHSLINATPEADAVEALTDQRMLERYGELVDDRAIERAADAAVHNEARGRFVAVELRALTRALNKQARTPAGGSVNALARAARELADRIVLRKPIKDIKPAKFSAAEVRAAKAAEKALAGNDLTTAVTEKRNQMVNFYAARAAHNALGRFEVGLRKMKRALESEGIDQEYRDQIAAILDRYNLRPMTKKEQQRAKSLVAWVDAQKAAGYEPVIDEDVLNEARRVPVRDLTVEEFDGLVASVENIAHLGRLKKKLLTAKDAREFAARVDEAEAAIRDNATRTIPEQIEKGRLARFRSGVKEFFVMHRKFANTIYEMDGWRDGGALWELFVRPMNEAGDREAVMREQATIRLAELFKAVSKDARRKVFIPEINTALTAEARIMVALNTGNAGNLQRLMDGDRWSIDQVKAITDTLTKEQWDFVQGVWDLIDEYRPMIAEQQKRITGVEPKWVEPTPVDTPHGVYRGGYFPAKYDTDRSTRSLSDEAAAGIMDQWRATRGAARTRDSFTKERAAKVIMRPLRKDFGVVTQHITEVTHRLAWQEYLIDATRLLNASQIDAAIREHYGPEVLRSMRDTIADVAAGEVGAQNIIEQWLNYLRVGTTIVGLGWNLTTGLLQPIGLTQSMVRIGPKWVAKGLAQWLGDAVRMESSVAAVYEKSEFMRLRGKTMQREISEIRNTVSGTDSRIAASYFYFIQKLQIVADMPTWLGMYTKAIETMNVDEATAVALADQAVLDAQSGGQVKDLAAAQRGGTMLKLFTNFYSFFNTTFNLTRVAYGRTNFYKPGEAGLFLVDMLLLYTVPAVLGTLLRAALQGDTDDEDELVKKLIAEQMSYLLGTMVGVRELGGATAAAFGLPASYSGPAGVRFFNEVQKLAKQIAQGEDDAAFFKALNSSAGILLHYPAGQLNRTAEGVNAYLNGETENPAALIVGPPR